MAARWFLGAFVALTGTLASAQHLEDVLVERYFVNTSDKDTEAPLVTYRIFLDLPTGYRLLMVFGEEHNELTFNTTTTFFNDTVNGVVYADRLKADRLNTGRLAMDSWLTMGAASNLHMGVPTALDNDGSVLECPPHGHLDLVKNRREQRPPFELCHRDGLHAIDSVPPVMAFRFEPGYLGKISGAVVHTMSGAWGVMGGMKGATEENIVLIAQLTTSGTLSFAINVEVLDRQGRVIRLVHNAPQLPEHILEPRLRVGMD